LPEYVPGKSEMNTLDTKPEGLLNFNLAPPVFTPTKINSLSDDSEMDRLFHFDSTRQNFQFYDPDPVSQEDVTDMIHGESYWIRAPAESPPPLFGNPHNSFDTQNPKEK
jgi:hypothetical protein